VAPSERAFFEAFFTWVYTPRAHADGSVDQIVDEALAFPHQQSVEAFQAQVDVCRAHDTADRLSQIAAPTLVLPGEFDVILPPRFGRFVAEGIPNARFEVPTSPSRRSRTSSTPASTASGAKSRRRAELTALSFEGGRAWSDPGGASGPCPQSFGRRGIGPSCHL
jgi:hypothetical protein